MRWGPEPGGPTGLRLAPGAQPHPSPGWGAHRECSPASGPCGRCLQGERGPVGREGRLPGIRGARLDTQHPRGHWASWQEVGSTQSSQPHHPPLLCRKSRALATSCTTTLASSSLKCRRLWMWLRMEPGHGEEGYRRRKGHLYAQGTAQHPPHLAQKPPLNLLGPKVFNQNCCADKTLRLHESSLPCMTLCKVSPGGPLGPS